MKSPICLTDWALTFGKTGRSLRVNGKISSVTGEVEIYLIMETGTRAKIRTVLGMAKGKTNGSTETNMMARGKPAKLMAKEPTRMPMAGSIKGNTQMASLKAMER